ncbi:MAG: hypothetical protein KAY24_00065 [Candidatus Eisenbacteria sp.]|nr:hypothetical protein [Candidatus Eisenbacteria bacterium]
MSGKRRAIVYYPGEPREDLDTALMRCPGFYAAGFDFPDNRREIVIDVRGVGETSHILSLMPDDAILGLSMVIEE